MNARSFRTSLKQRYFDESPYAQSNGVHGPEEMLRHFEHRQELELRICSGIFPDKVRVLESKAYSDNDLGIG